MAVRTILIGVGGASCSGKTTLAKHLVRILPRCLLLHQDDYAPPEEDIPLHPVHGVKDWDAPSTAIEWPRLREDLKRVKHDSTGSDSLDDAKRSHEHLSLLTEVPIDEARVKHWQERFQELAPDHRDTDTPRSTRPGTGAGLRHRFVLVDGFLMFYDQQVSDLLDVRILIRARKDVLKARRLARNERIADDSFWKDPPGIFENVVWPAYVEAHAKHFIAGDVEHGALSPDQEQEQGEGAGMVLLDDDGALSMDEMVERSCGAIYQAVGACARTLGQT